MTLDFIMRFLPQIKTACFLPVMMLIEEYIKIMNLTIFMLFMQGLVLNHPQRNRATHLITNELKGLMDIIIT